MIDTGCTGSCKFNYHTTTTMTKLKKGQTKCSNVTSGLYMIKLMTEQRTVLWMCKLISVINVCWLFIVCSQIFCHCGLISSSSVSTIEYKLSKCTYKCTIVHWILRFLFFVFFFFFFNFLEIKNRTISSIYSFKFVCWL
jgi:hypothetical protein